MARERKQFMKISQKEFMQAVEALAEQKANRKLQMMIGQQKPGQSPGDDKTGDNRHDKGWPPPAPLAPKLANANNIRGTGKPPLANDDSYGRGNVPGHPDWKLAGSGIYKGIPNKFDQILDPSGTQKVRPTLDQLREGVRHKKGLA